MGLCKFRHELVAHLVRGKEREREGKNGKEREREKERNEERRSETKRECGNGDSRW
jgi:hypothetical protein